MTTRPLSLAVALLAPLVASTIAVGQPEPSAPPPAPPQYQVEILVFANREFDASEERFDALPAREAAVPILREAPRFDDSSFGLPGESAVGALDEPLAPADPAEFRFRLLRPDELQLGGEYRTLERLAAYSPLLHGGWIQPGLPEDQARPFDLSLLGALNPRGSVQVYLSRFLHVQLDLTYQEPAGPTGATAPRGPDELSEVALAPRYRLETERQTRSGELHYFDHPAFGVLVKITPLPALVPGGPAPAPGRPAA